MKKGAPLIGTIVTLAIIGYFWFQVNEPFFNYKKEAETYVNSCVYKDLGIVAERFTGDVVYKKGEDVLVEVKFYLEGDSTCDGVYCVYFRSKYVSSCTEMLPSGFDCETRLDELKALFGI